MHKKQTDKADSKLSVSDNEWNSRNKGHWFLSENEKPTNKAGSILSAIMAGIEEIKDTDFYLTMRNQQMSGNKLWVGDKGWKSRNGGHQCYLNNRSQATRQAIKEQQQGDNAYKSVPE